MRKFVALGVLLGAMAFTACEGFGQAMTGHTDVLARAAGYELTVQRVSELLEENPRLPAQAEVVEAVGNLWIDYILLAREVVADPELSGMDMGPIIQPQVEQAMVYKLRDEVIQVDTTFTEEELRRAFDEERPGQQVRARHILLQVPPDATPAQRDSVLGLARELRARAAGGENFATLAEEHSQDPGSAARGGDLGFFGRGQMVAPFEEAAFALDAGEVSPVVESPFGYHVIMVEETRTPDFESARETFARQLRQSRLAEAEDAYIQQVIEPRAVEAQPDAPDVVREIARNPGQRLTSRAARRPLVRYSDGAYTAGDFAELARRSNPRQLAGIAASGDEDISTGLLDLARNKILIEQARAQGLELTAAERDSLEAEARRQVLNTMNVAGLTPIEPREGESPAAAVERHVGEVIAEVVRGERNVIPLGPIAASLREEHRTQLFQRAIPQVLARVEQSRAAAPQGAPGEGMPGQPVPGVEQPADTVAPSPPGM